MRQCRAAVALVVLLAWTGSSAVPAAGSESLEAFASKRYEFSLEYPSTLRPRESRPDGGGALWRVSFFAASSDQEPCFSVEARKLDSLAVSLKTLGTYRYDPKRNEWRLEPDYDAESSERLEVSYLTAARIPAYASVNSMANYYRDETIITDKGYALVLHYSDACGRPDAQDLNARLAASLRLRGAHAKAARIVNPPLPRDD